MLIATVVPRNVESTNLKRSHWQGEICELWLTRALPLLMSSKKHPKVLQLFRWQDDVIEAKLLASVDAKLNPNPVEGFPYTHYKMGSVDLGIQEIDFLERAVDWADLKTRHAPSVIANIENQGMRVSIVEVAKYRIKTNVRMAV